MNETPGTVRVAVGALWLATSIAISAFASAQQDWTERIEKTMRDEHASWPTFFALGQDLAEAPGREGLDVLTRMWPSIDNISLKQQIIKAWHLDRPTPFRTRFHPHAFEFYLMVLDQEEADVSEWVLIYLPAYAWRTFESEQDARKWLETHRREKPMEVAIAAMKRWTGALKATDQPGGLVMLLPEIGHPLRRNEPLRDVARELDLTQILLDAIEHPEVTFDAVVGAASTLSALEPRQFPAEKIFEFLAPFEERREKQAIDEQQRLMASLDLRTVRGDERKRWVLHAPHDEAPPAEGYGLLVVLPGGDGSIEFTPFIRDTIRTAAGDDYVVIQMIAPPIEEDRNAVVWPRERLPDDRVDFTMEPIVHAAVEVAMREYAIDAGRVWAMGWSSGGPPAYQVTLMPDSPFAGAFVIMSVFKPQLLSPLEGAAGKAYYILHSPQDFIRMDFPRAAQKQLREAGGRTKLQEYEGGHGWHGNIGAFIERAIEWLEDAPPPK